MWFLDAAYAEVLKADCHLWLKQNADLKAFVSIF